MRGLLIVLIGAAALSTASAEVLYVPAQYEIREAMNVAVAGDTVLVACGEYMVGRPAIVMKSGVCLLGETGEPGCATVRGIPLECDLLYCDNVDHTAHIEGITFRTLRGNNLTMINSSPIFYNCSFFNDDIPGPFVSIYHGSPVYEHCTFEGESTVFSGEADSLLLEDCRFIDNELGICELSGTSLRAIRCTFEGAHLYNYPLLYVWLDDLEIQGCTIAHYVKEYSTVDALIFAGQTNVSISNTIIAENLDFEELVWGDFSTWTLDVTCCDIWGNTGGNWVGDLAPYENINGNISEDPWFCGSLNADDPLSLHITSPCAPYTPPNPECDQIGARPIGCTLSDAEDVHLDSQTLQLDAAYPNPSSGTVAINFSCGTEMNGNALVEIYDAQGRRVRLFSLEVVGTGLQTVQWNGCDDLGRALPIGIYTYRLTLGEMAESRKVVIVR